MTDDANAAPLDDDEAEAQKVLGASKPWLDALQAARTAFQPYQDRCDNIDAKYASLKDMASAAGDREFKIFWANLEVLKPTIYSRPPQPVVMPRHKGGPDLHRKAAEMLERVLVVDAEMDDLHETLKAVRDDLALSGRGVPWVLDSGSCLHVDRADFLHEPARKWKEVGWVARRAYLTREQLEERFAGADLRHVKYDVVQTREGVDDDFNPIGKKCAVWEIWSRTDSKVVWVTEGVETVLDERPPLFDVKGFFPCPKPAYGTLEPRTLKPVPDFVYYRDQADEINEMTARIAALADALQVRGFYAAGSVEIAEAVEKAFKETDKGAILVPVSAFAATGAQTMKDSIVWLPVAEIAEVITGLVALRRQLIQDVYEITGLSDIMRGSTEAEETATAQNLKAQYGSVRVRERQAEMVRVACDVLRLKAEIYAERVPVQELAEMAQMHDLLPAQTLMQQALTAGQQPDPNAVTLEAVGQLLADQRLRPFALEVESDSTIAPNEQEEKASRMEFLTAMAGFIQQAGGMVAERPETAPFAGALMKFAAGSFRASRELGTEIDQFVEMVKAKAAQAEANPQPDPEAMKLQVEQQRLQMDGQKIMVEMQGAQQKLALEMQKLAAEIEKIRAETMRILAQAANPPQPSQPPARAA